MPKLLQINIGVNRNSTGRIAEQIGILAKSDGWDSYIAYGRSMNPSQSNLIKIGTKYDVYEHVLETRLFDNHGLASRNATKRLIKKIDEIKPDIVHLHNIHGYYINYRILFEYLKISDSKVVWTCHDCWSFTGHCSHFAEANCYKWQETQGCHACPQLKSYPDTMFFDRSNKNWSLKKSLFTCLGDRLTLVPVSKWLASNVEKSFFNGCNIYPIFNGVDTTIFSPAEPTLIERVRDKYGLHDKHILVGVASAWPDSKGIKDYIALSAVLPEDYRIIMVGVSEKLRDELPSVITTIPRTDDAKELAAIYSLADVSLNLSYQESFGLTTIEAMACGTPGVVFNCTASPELISPETGLIVEKSDIPALKEAIMTIVLKGKNLYKESCRNRATTLFDKEKQFKKYIELYNNILTNKL